MRLRSANFDLNIAHSTDAAGALSGESLAHHVNHAADACEGIANFMDEAGSEFAESGQVFGAAHFTAMEFLDFKTVAFELLDYFVELAPKLADVVPTLVESDTGGQITAADAGNGIHQVFEGPFDQNEKNREQDEAEENGETDRGE